VSTSPDYPDHVDAYLAEHIREALAGDERTAGVEIDVAIHGGAIVLLGSVTTPQRRIAAEEVARSLAPDHSVQNELLVVDFTEEPRAGLPPAVRIAAMADVHFGADARGTLHPHMERLHEQADLLLIAGDITRIGDPAEAGYFLEEIAPLRVPAFAVLGNHDHHTDRADEVAVCLGAGGVRVLEGAGDTVDINGVCVGVAGAKGFGGGFLGASGSDFGEPEMKAFIRHTKERAAALEAALMELTCDLRIALLHYSPIPETLQGERLEIFPFLGSYLLAEAIDRAGADLVFHGHAHAGAEQGITPGGVHVRNVAQPVIRRAYSLYHFDRAGGPPQEAPQAEFAGWRYLAH
jgi:Icc-related predicted phosphoesterase